MPLFVDKEYKLSEDDFRALTSESDLARGIVDREARRPERGYVFIAGEPDEDDIQQQFLGNCWFLSALSSLAFSNHGDRQLVPVLNKTYNNKNGPTRGKLVFQFFHFNKLIRVYIDDILPAKQITHIQKKGEYWVALCEKAYAKLLGSYEIQDGGWPRYSFYHLTCGIPIDVYFKDYTDRELPQVFEIMKDIMENNPEVVWNAGNLYNNRFGQPAQKSLQTGHAYSILKLDEVKDDHSDSHHLILIRNPHGRSYSSEWTGDWSDDSSKWRSVSSHDRKRLRDYQSAPSWNGSFWMSFNDFVKYFEIAILCRLPTNWSNKDETRVYGKFKFGINAPPTGGIKIARDDEEFHHQILIKTENSYTDIWLHFLLDSPYDADRQKFNTHLEFYENVLERTPFEKYSVSKINEFKKQHPIFPGRPSKFYDYNGRLYGRVKKGTHLVTFSACPTENGISKCDFLLKIVSKNARVIEIGKQELRMKNGKDYPWISWKDYKRTGVESRARRTVRRITTSAGTSGGCCSSQQKMIL